MGAVRDASDEEICALIEAALSLNMRCVGANLGRTAEFTSKIVTALVAHAREHRLHAAVRALPAISTVERGGTASSGVTKLAPQRAGAWSWDGASNKLSKLDKLDKQSSMGKRKHEALENTDAAQHSEVSKTSEKDVHPAESTLQHHMHFVAWLHLDVSAVTDDLDQRESMLGLVQLIVTSLWRSRLASEAAHEQNASDSSVIADAKARPAEHSTVPKVVPVLHLVFKDGRMATLTQARLAIVMANQHMAAPSEYQVLQTLLSCLKDPAVLVTLPAAASDDEVDVKDEVLTHVLPAGLRKSQRKAVRVVELTDTAQVSHAAARTTFGGKAINKTAAQSTKSVAVTSTGGAMSALATSDDIFSLAECGYAGKCGCGGGSTRQEGDVHIVVLLNRTVKKNGNSADSGLITEENKKSQDRIMRSLYQYVYPDKEISVDSAKIAKKMSDMIYRGPLFSADANALLTSPSIAVTVLQHFAYHDRLYAAIEDAVAKN